MMPTADPAAAVKEIANKIEEKVKESGLDGCEQFVGTLDTIKGKAKAGPGDLMDKVKGAIDDLKGKVKAAMDDPGSLAPGGGGLAACASWYASAVIDKLKALMKEIEALFDKLVEVIKNMAGPFKSLGETMENAMDGINKTMSGLTALPKKVTELSNKVKGPEDLTNVDTGGMKKDLDTSGVDGPLSSLEGLKDSMGPMIDDVKKGIDSLSGFVTDAPQRIKESFQVPTPLCCMTSCAMSNAPPAMMTMMEQVEQLRSFDLDPVVKLLQEMHDKLANIDVAMVKDPMKKFSEMAGEQVDALDKVVSAAKMAAGIPDMPGKGGCGCLPKK